MGRSAASELLMLENDDTDEDDDNYYMSSGEDSDTSTENDEDSDAPTESQAQQPLTTDAQALAGNVLQLYAIKNGRVTIQSPKTTATVDPATSRTTSVRIGVEQEPGPTHDWSENWVTAIGPEPAKHRYRVCLHAPGDGKQLAFVIMPTPVERQMVDDLLKKAAGENMSKQSRSGGQSDKTPDALVNGIRPLLLSVSDPASAKSMEDLPAWAQETIRANAGGYVYSTTLLKQQLAASKRKLKNKALPSVKPDESGSTPARKKPSGAGPKAPQLETAESLKKTPKELPPAKAEPKLPVKRSLPFNEKTKATRDLGCAPLTETDQPVTKRRRFTVSLEVTADQLVQVEALLDSKSA